MTAPGLLLVAHGSRDPRARAATEAVGAAVAARRPQVAVTAAYLDHARPTVAEALARARGPLVVVPLLLASGWHEHVDLPAQLVGAGVPVRVTRPLGPHPALAGALRERLATAGAPPHPTTAVVLAAVGSRDPRAAADVAAVASALRGWREVALASVAAGNGPDTVARLRARGGQRVAVAAYVLAPGLLPDRFADWGADVVTAPLGAAPAVRDVILARYARAARHLTTAVDEPLPRPA